MQLLVEFVVKVIERFLVQSRHDSFGFCILYRISVLVLINRYIWVCGLKVKGISKRFLKFAHM